MQKSWGSFWEGILSLLARNFKLCLDEFQIAADQAEMIGNEPLKASIDAMKGWIYYDRGDFEISRKHFKRWFDLFAEQAPQFGLSHEAMYFFNLGLLDLKQGQIDSAKSGAKKVESILSDISSEDKDLVKYFYDILSGEILLAEGSAQQAIAIGEKISGIAFRLTTGYGDTVAYNMPFFKDVVARAYYENGELDKAIAAYEKSITFDPQKKARYLVHPIYHYRLAKLYQEKGLTAKAIEHYEKFLALWKDADPGLPEVADARERVALLKQN